jgi:hypothetical protein
MMRKALSLSLLALVALTSLAAAASAQAEVSSGKDIHVAPGAIQDKVFSLGGNVLIEGTVREDVFVIGGSITIAGEVGQSVVGIGSRIIVKSTARIGEDLAALGGTLVKEPGCAIAGDTIYFQTREIGDKLFRDGDFFSLLFAFPIIPVIVIIKLVVIFLWLIAAVLGAALFPKPIAYAAGEVRKNFWPVFGTGLVAILVFMTLILVAALLSVILIGIPLFLALGAAGFIVMVVGRLAVLYFLGEASLRALGSKGAGAMGALLFGLLVFSLAGFVPVLGFLFGFVMNAVGWGVAIRTKFGTRENWFQKKPAC